MSIKTLETKQKIIKERQKVCTYDGFDDPSLKGQMLGYLPVLAFIPTSIRNIS